MSFRPAVVDCDIMTFGITRFSQAFCEGGNEQAEILWGRLMKEAHNGFRHALRARRERPRCRRAAECCQQFPPSDGDCHTPLRCEVRKGDDTTPRWCSLHVQGAGCWLLPP